MIRYGRHTWQSMETTKCEFLSVLSRSSCPRPMNPAAVNGSDTCAVLPAREGCLSLFIQGSYWRLSGGNTVPSQLTTVIKLQPQTESTHLP